MISIRSYTQKWIMGVREASPRMDPILIEKIIMALTLVESLWVSGLDLIFKEGDIDPAALIIDSPILHIKDGLHQS